MLHRELVDMFDKDFANETDRDARRESRIALDLVEHKFPKIKAVHPFITHRKYENVGIRTKPIRFSLLEQFLNHHDPHDYHHKLTAKPHETSDERVSLPFPVRYLFATR